MTLKTLVPTIMSFVLLPVLLSGQGKGVDPAQLLKPLGESWPTHSGDYTGRRFSSLKQIDRTTVKTLTLAWVQTLVEGPGSHRLAGAADAAAPTGPARHRSSSVVKAPASSRPAA